MNDQTKRQLELAAKAIGLELTPMEVKNVSEQGDDRFIGYMVNPEKWPRGWFAPHTDDADSRQLQVALRMRVAMGTDAEGEFWTASAGEVCAVEWVGANGGNHELAVRLAVLKCAYRYSCDAGMGDAP